MKVYFTKVFLLFLTPQTLKFGMREIVITEVLFYATSSFILKCDKPISVLFLCKKTKDLHTVLSCDRNNSLCLNASLTLNLLSVSPPAWAAYESWCWEYFDN